MVLSCEIENRELLGLSLFKMPCLGSMTGGLLALEYFLFLYLMKGSCLWWSSLCVVYAHCITKEKSLSCLLAAGSAEPHTRRAVGSHEPGDSCSFLPAVNVLGVKGTLEQG